MKTQEAQVSDLIDWLKLRNYSPATMRAYGSALRQFLEWRDREGLGVVFSQEDARGYLFSRYDAGRRWLREKVMLLGSVWSKQAASGK